MLAAVLLLLFGQACGDGELEERTTYHGNNQEQVKETYSVVRGDPPIREGTYKRFYKNGQLAEELVFRRDRLWEVVHQFDEAGNELEGSQVSEGKGTYVSYSPGGNKVGQVQITDGLPAGQLKVFSPEGMEVASIRLRDGLPGSLPAGSAEGLTDLEIGSGDSLAMPDLRRGGGQLQRGQLRKDVDPGIADRMMGQFKQQRASALYAALHPKVKQQYQQPAYQDYINFLIKIYGPVQSFKRIDYGVQDHPQAGEVLQAMYDVQFKYVRAAVMVYMVPSGGEFRLFELAIQTEDYAPISEIKNAGDPIMEYIKNGNWEGLYNAASVRFQQMYTLEEMKQLGQQFAQLGQVSSYQLYTHQVLFIENKVSFIAVYEATIEGKGVPIQLSFTRFNGQFKLEAVNTVSPEQMQQGMQQQMPAP